MKIIKWIFRVILFFIILIALFYLIYWGSSRYTSQKLLDQLGQTAPSLQVDGFSYRDLNKNGRLDVYEDVRASIDSRVVNLINMMTLEEKAGCMFVGMIGMTEDGNMMKAPIISSDPLTVMVSNFIPHGPDLIGKKMLNSFAPFGVGDAQILARYHNNLQQLAERTRLGIPITLATDPRHTIEFQPGISQGSAVYSSWPSQLGLAATNDTLIARSFGDIARQEYLATGFRLALHPMADLATEPRWPRVSGTFGEDMELASAMLRNYIVGFQGDFLNKESVACMSKHFPGSGTHTEGDEPHFWYGAEQSFSGDNFTYHVQAFSKGTKKTAQIMTSYGIIKDQTSENVATAFNKELITNLLRDSLQFDGVVCTDWNVVSDGFFMNLLKGGSASWGVEDLSALARVEKAINAGVDQFGGEHIPELIVQLVNEGRVSIARIDQSVRRILHDKFKLGLFDNPYVDEKMAKQVVGNPQFRAKGEEAQHKSMVLLKNDGILPLKRGTSIYMEGYQNSSAIEELGVLVKKPEEADVIVKRIETPYEPKNDYLLESFLGQTGRLYFTEEELASYLQYTESKPTIFIINLKRAAILTPIDDVASALVAEFGSSEATIMEMLFGKFKPSGKLPIELPSSWSAVESQLEDVPYDSEKPLYRFGHGLSYK